MICNTPGKTKYPTQLDAKAALFTITTNQYLKPHNKSSKVPKREYKCECGYWHLTKQKAI